MAPFSLNYYKYKYIYLKNTQKQNKNTTNKHYIQYNFNTSRRKPKTVISDDAALCHSATTTSSYCTLSSLLLCLSLYRSLFLLYNFICNFLSSFSLPFDFLPFCLIAYILRDVFSFKDLNRSFNQDDDDDYYYTIYIVHHTLHFFLNKTLRFHANSVSLFFVHPFLNASHTEHR